MGQEGEYNLGRSAVGVDFGSQYVKVAKLRRQGQRIVIERLVKIARSAAEAAEEVAAGLGQAGMRVSRGVMGVSGRGAIIRYTMVPPVPAYRLKMIMDYEIGELAGKSSEAVSSDYKILNVPREISQDFTVMVAMSKDEYVRESMHQLSSAGVHVGHILPTPLALHNTYVTFGDYEEGRTCLVADIGATNIDVAIMNGGDLFFARSIGRGADEFTEALSESLAVGFPEAERIKLKEGMIATGGWRSEREKKISDALASAADRLYATLNSSVNFASRQLKLKNLKIEKVILAGGGSNLPGLPEYLARSFDAEVVAPDFQSYLGTGGEDTARIQLAKDMPDEDTSQASPSLREFATAIGLAMARIDPSCYIMDLMPADEKKKRVFKERTVYLYAGGAVLLAFLFVTLVAAWSEQASARDRQEKLEERLEEANERLHALRELNDENAQLTAAIEHLAGVTESGNFMTQLLFLTRRGDITPGEVKIKEMLLRGPAETEEGRKQPMSVLLRGRVESQTGDQHDIVKEFRDQLLKTELVNSAEIDPSRTLMDRGEFKFEIIVSPGRAK